MGEYVHNFVKSYNPENCREINRMYFLEKWGLFLYYAWQNRNMAKAKISREVACILSKLIINTFETGILNKCHFIKNLLQGFLNK